MVGLPGLNNWLRNLCSAACVEDQTGEGLEEKPTVVALEEGLGEEPFTFPSCTYVDLFSHHLAAALTLPVCLVECLELARFGRQFISVPFDQLQVELRVEFFEQRHR